jgi:hypothetical protein
MILAPTATHDAGVHPIVSIASQHEDPFNRLAACQYLTLKAGQSSGRILRWS